MDHHFHILWNVIDQLSWQTDPQIDNLTSLDFLARARKDFMRVHNDLLSRHKAGLNYR